MITTTPAPDRNNNSNSSTEQHRLVLQGEAYDNFVNAIRTEATQEIYIFELRKFMSYHNKQHVSDVRLYDRSGIKANVIAWIVHLRKQQGLAHITISSYLVF
jgi:hypothetical protein